MIRYMLDTDICIEIIRRKSLAVLACLRKHAAGSVAISSITLAELQYGVAKSRDPDRNRLALVHFLAPLEVLSFDNIAALAYGKVRGGLERAGQPIGPLDTLIAAHALAAKLTLVTNNQREFSRVADLQVESWGQA
jgi:tRNA(fMet)-specific endonuclease VapC